MYASFFIILLEYSLFTVLCQFQVYSIVIQLYIYIYSFFLSFFSHIGYYRILSRVPCAKHQVLLGSLFYIWQCVYINPKLLIQYFLYGRSASNEFSSFCLSGNIFVSPSFFKNYFLLAYSCFTMLCQFLLYSKVNQLYVCFFINELNNQIQQWI